ncbi:MAG: hypothetical protein AAF492_23770, partial [Verrucomicrobiota bacterium]
ESSAAITLHQAIRMIELAVDCGVPAFNEGHIADCVAIYHDVSRRLLNQADLPAKAHAVLKHALSAADHAPAHDTKAWKLRHGLDRVYALLDHSLRD